ncbi:hypothetical protein KGZ04_30765, partial [Pseudomonas aeruginosa]|uniref:hypothetical protein n=1 Tax=Pseudomonas aeruginosa TaxID=287 RepID=UPI002341D215
GHTHRRSTNVVDGTSPLSALVPSAAVGAATAFPHPGLLGHQLQVLVNGVLQAPESWAYDATTNTLAFLTTIPARLSGQHLVDILYTEEIQAPAEADVAGMGHVHMGGSIESASTPEIYQTFDDGGEFDDEENGQFDDTRRSNVVHMQVNR